MSERGRPVIIRVKGSSPLDGKKGSLQNQESVVSVMHQKRDSNCMCHAPICLNVNVSSDHFVGTFDAIVNAWNIRASIDTRIADLVQSCSAGYFRRACDNHQDRTKCLGCAVGQMSVHATLEQTRHARSESILMLLRTTTSSNVSI